MKHYECLMPARNAGLSSHHDITWENFDSGHFERPAFLVGIKLCEM
jgi:hypothetical protein